jgi:hypothetical protein
MPQSPLCARNPVLRASQVSANSIARYICYKSVTFACCSSRIPQYEKEPKQQCAVSRALELWRIGADFEWIGFLSYPRGDVAYVTDEAGRQSAFASLGGKMKKQLLCIGLAAIGFLPQWTTAQPVVLWRAFNDHRPSTLTHVNATTYDLRITDDGGVLKNIETGEDLTAKVRVVLEPTVEGAVPDDFGAISARIVTGSPADKLFSGYVDTGGPDNGGLTGLRDRDGMKLILVFEGLDPTKRYNFRGTVARAGGYNDRWSVFGITGADSYVSAHEDGSTKKNIFTLATFPSGTLATNEVALNTGDNKEGSLVGWDNIDPGADGTFSIEGRQYTGPAPFGNPAAATPGSYAYGLNAIYLAEVQSTGNLKVTENPSNQNVPAGQTATFKVVATSPQTIIYQWQKADPGKTTFVDVPGANQALYTTPVLTAADSGSKYHVKLSSGGAETTTPAVELLVDATIPGFTSVTSSINLNALYLTFSEPMNLEILGASTNYQLSGGLSITSAVPLDPQTVRLLTSTKQTAGSSYTVTLNNLQDIAGNKIVANSAKTFNAFNVTSNSVGVEIWRSVGGSAVTDIRNDTNYPAKPNEDYVIASFDTFLLPALTNSDNNTYSGRMRAWITPEETGDYEFFIRADDQGELRVSTDEKFDRFDDPDVIANELPTAADTTAGDTFQEPGTDDSVSQPVHLEKGKRYAMQALWKESNGGDYLQIAWRKVGDTTPADQLTPIPSKFLSYYGPATAASAGPEPAIAGITLDAGQIVIDWTGSALESSSDLKTWAAEAGAARPFKTAPQGYKFFRAKR